MSEQNADLIERLEKATGRDHILNSNIHARVGRPDPHMPADYTGSIDAALTLLPKGWEPHRLAFPQGNGRTFAFEIFPPSGHPRWSKGSICERGNTAPLAILRAIFEARAADRDTGPPS